MRLALHRSAHPLTAAVTWLLVVFLVLFPKGGFKLAVAPITWGYLLLAATAPLLLVPRLLAMPLRIRPAALAALAAALPFQVLVVYSYAANGTSFREYAVSIFVNFFALPLLFLWLYPGFYPRVDPERFRRVFCGSVAMAAAWGILLFFLWPLTGHLLEIPLLTVNLADYGTITATKHIYRGPFLKLISTYNNGNVYGVATLLLLPLYTRLERHRSRRWLVRTALFLTLSRTVWFGLIVEQLLTLAPALLRNARTFPRLRLGAAGRQLLVLGGIVVAILTVFLGLAGTYSLSFLLDPTLGGRTGELSILSQATWLPSVPITGFTEILFASAITNYGYTGFLALTLLFVSPFLVVAARPAALDDPIRRAACKALLLYLIVALSDGATNLIPVMAFYWFVYSVLLYGLPGTGTGRATPDRPAPSPAETSWAGSPAPARL